MLIHFGVTPYMVFDGDYLPSKAVTEAERAIKRDESKKLGLELHRLGKPSQAHLELQKAVDVTPEMARQLIEELKRLGVQYVVAPYEADAQLAYLERKGIIHGILSEDSDLLVFGAKRLLTKLDQYGDCIEINRNDFTACRDISLVGWSDVEFRRMAILSGCDYLPSINKMGLKTAYRLVRKHKTIEKIIRILKFDGQFHVPTGYLESFRKAELTFLHQRVFCPLTNALIMNTGIAIDTEPEDLAFIGHDVDKDTAIGVARGDLHPMTKKPIIVQNKIHGTPRTPYLTSRRQSFSEPCDPKAMKSIDSFFKPKRTPLAELDPNVFTPSPSQQRLLRRYNEPRSSHSASTYPPQLRSSTSLPSSASTPPLQTMRMVANSTGTSVSAHHPSKRQRLCSEAGDLQLNCQQSSDLDTGRSRFFTSSVPDQSPLIPKKGKGKKREGQEVNIWSDDSIEDAMAKLPDASDEKGLSEEVKIAVFQDESPESVTSVQCGSSQNHHQIQEASLNSGPAESTAQSSLSTTTSSTSASHSAHSVVRSLDEHVISELALLNDRYSYSSSSAKSKSSLESENKTKPGVLSPSIQYMAKPPRMRQGGMTPLQRLGLGALNRTKPYNEPLHVIAGCTKVTKTSVEVAMASKASEQSSEILHCSQKQAFSSLSMKGSEDIIIPNSEDEDDGSISGSELGDVMPKVDFGRFAFTGWA